eukprot:PhM_4_TR555/c0_g1_i1/m.37329/K00428/E1.11.1.5; cytochrome c peroxidase
MFRSFASRQWAKTYYNNARHGKKFFAVAAATATSGLFFTATTVFAADSPYTRPDIKAARAHIQRILEDDPGKGSLFVRLAWHAAGTWDAKKKDGFANMASMRFAPECNHAANAGLGIARNALEPVKKAVPGITYADLWALAAVVAIEEAGGPAIPFRWGRTDAASSKQTTPEGRLPDATQGQEHIRDVFGRMGFNDRETVALIGAHTLGACHADRSGFVGPWTHDPIGFDNGFFSELLDNDWIVNTNIRHKLQFTDSKTRKLMMLPTDIALLLDPAFKKTVEAYANDMELFHDDFAKAYKKLVELGVPESQLRPE